MRFIEYMDVGGATERSRSRCSHSATFSRPCRNGTVHHSRFEGTDPPPRERLSPGQWNDVPGLSHPQRRHSAAPAMPAGSPRTGRGFCACTRPAASIYGSHYAMGRPMRICRADYHDVAAARSRCRGAARRRDDAPGCIASRVCAPIRIEKCTLEEDNAGH